MILEELLNGLCSEEFYADYWDQVPLRVPGHPDRFKKLYSIKEFESRLTESDLRFPQIKVTSDGTVIDKSEYTTKRTIGGVETDNFIDVPAVYRLWNEKATITIHSLHTNAPSIIPWLRQLELELCHPVQANAYITPPYAKGFKVHYDTHDVFILQAHGQKHWRVWENRDEAKPLDNESFEAPSEYSPSGPPIFDDKLTQGEVLYIPRGYLHEARSGDDVSLHITVGVLVNRLIDALEALMNSVLQTITEGGSQIWRDTLSSSYLSSSDAAFDTLKDDTLALMSDMWSTKFVANKFRNQLWPVNLDMLSNTVRIDALGTTSRLEVAPFVTPIIERSGERLTLLYSGRRLELPLTAESALNQMMAKAEFTPEDLSDYERQSSIGLCRRLLKDGFLRFSDALDAG